MELSEMANDPKEKQQSVPYISWKTFTGFIGSIHGKVPAQIDASILRNMSGTARSQLLSTLKFLKLVDSEGITQDSLKKLADAFNGDQWKPALAQFIRHSYGKIVGDLNVETATPAMLRERFRNNGGVEGGTIDLALRFYLSALKEADVKFSDHLVMRQRAPKGTGTRKRGNSKGASEVEIDDDEIVIPDGTFEVPFTVLGIAGSAILPDDLSPEQWDAISDYVKMVLGYRIKAQKPKAGA
jgi:hypothetical protein